MKSARSFLRAALCALLALGAHTSVAQMWRWTDAAGRTHFADTPPPPGATNVRRQTPTQVPAAPAGGEPYSVRTARERSPVTLFSAPGCEACDLARALLSERGIPFREVSVVHASDVARLEREVGANAVPALVVGGSVLKGFETGGYQRLLDSAGYPKTGILPPRKQAVPAPEKAQPQTPSAEEEAPARPDVPTGPYAPR